MKAIIFDFDGVVVDTVKLHIKIQTQFLKKHKIYSENLKDFKGVKVNEIIKTLAKQNNKKISEEEVRRLTEEYWTILKKKATSIKPFPGINQLIIKLKDNGFRLAIASSSNKQFVHAILNNSRLRSFFEVIITGDQVKKGKPNPDVFLLAAKRMMAQPEDCIVVEDAFAGLKAAKRAKMKAVGVMTKIPDKCPCDLHITDIKKLDVEALNKIF